MKKTIIILLLCLAAVPAFVSCKENDDPGVPGSYINSAWCSRGVSGKPDVELVFLRNREVRIRIGDAPAIITSYTRIVNGKYNFKDKKTVSVTLTDGDKSAVVSYTYEDATDKGTVIDFYLNATVISNPDNLEVQTGRFKVPLYH